MQYDLFNRPKPEAPKPTARKPRWYQQEAIGAAMASLSEHRSALVVMATGLGKTFLFASIAKMWAGKVLVIAHRDELISQAKEALESITGEKVGTEKAELRAGRERIVVASIQTMHKRKDTFSPDHFSLIIIDEAHRAPARSYTAVTSYFSEAKVLGVTATPDRSDEKAMGKVFDDVAYVMDIEDGIDAGYLVPIEGLEVFASEVNLDLVSTSAGDLNQGELDIEMTKATATVVKETHRKAGDKQVIIFTPGVASAHAMCDAMNELAPGKAIAVDGTTDPDKRKALVAGFKSGRYQFFFNCQVATEGFDAPETSIVAIARPTKSRSLYAQMVGRGTRVVAGTVDHIDGKDGAGSRRAAVASSRKPSCLILDFVGNSQKHSLVGPVDILGGSYSDEEVKLAKKKLKDAPEGTDIRSVLEESKKELKTLALRMAAAKAQVKSKEVSFDPFKIAGMNRKSEDYLSARFGSVPMSERQHDSLRKFGVSEKDLSTMDKRSASKMLAKLMERADKGLASLWQIEKLSKHLQVPKEVTFSQAMQACEYLKRTRNPDKLHLQLLLSVKNASINGLF